MVRPLLNGAGVFLTGLSNRESTGSASDQRSGAVITDTFFPEYFSNHVAPLV